MDHLNGKYRSLKVGLSSLPLPTDKIVRSKMFLEFMIQFRGYSDQALGAYTFFGHHGGMHDHHSHSHEMTHANQFVAEKTVVNYSLQGLLKSFNINADKVNQYQLGGKDVTLTMKVNYEGNESDLLWTQKQFNDVGIVFEANQL